MLRPTPFAANAATGEILEEHHRKSKSKSESESKSKSKRKSNNNSNSKRISGRLEAVSFLWLTGAPRSPSSPLTKGACQRIFQLASGNEPKYTLAYGCVVRTSYIFWK